MDQSASEVDQNASGAGSKLETVSGKRQIVRPHGQPLDHYTIEMTTNLKILGLVGKGKVIRCGKKDGRGRYYRQEKLFAPFNSQAVMLLC